MEYKMTLRRVYETEFYVEADSLRDAIKMFKAIDSDTLYNQELEQMNVVEASREVEEA